MMNQVEIFLRDDHYYLHSLSQLKTGEWVGCGFDEVHARSEPGLFDKFTAALEASAQGIDQRIEWEMEALARLAGVKSYPEFARGVKLVLVAEDNGDMTFYPTIRRRQEHFSFNSSLKLDGSPRSDDELRELLDEAFSRSR